MLLLWVLGGLTIAFQKSAEFLGTSYAIGQYLMYIELAIFAIVTLIYLVKLLKYPQAVINEWKHPVRINFFSAVSISLLMLAIIYRPEYKALGSYFFYAGTALHTFMTLYTLSFWINHNQELNHSNPAWFIPIVGNVLVPVSGAGLVDKSFLIYYFSIGLFFWIILTAMLFNRIIFHKQMAQKFMPTLFIFIALPAVAFIAYFKLTHNVDFFTEFLYSTALFFTLLIFFMYKQF